MWNGFPEHFIDVILDFNKPDIEDQWNNQACQLEDAMVAGIFNSSDARVVVTGVLVVICKLV